MSVLTKLFVVLLVVCSLMLSAAVVVFVNRVDDYQRASQQNTSALNAAKAQASSMQNRVSDFGLVCRCLYLSRSALFLFGRWFVN